MPSPARKEGLANEDASGEEIFEDSESPVFSVNLEKAAFTAKRCNLPSSHGMETGPLGMLPWGHAAPNARDGDADLISISLINFSPLPWARFRADNRRFPTHVRETLFALSHRLQLTSCPPPPPPPSCLIARGHAPRLIVVETRARLFRNSQEPE